MVTTDEQTHTKKAGKTKKRETRYSTDDYSLPASLNTRHEKRLICPWLNLHLFSFFFFSKVEY